MKKLILPVLVSLFLFTGCGSSNGSVVCTRTIEQSGHKIEIKLIGNLKGKYLDSVEVVYNTDSEEIASQFCAIYSSAKCSGTKVTLSGDAALQLAGVSEAELHESTKSDFVEGIESTGFTCK